MPEQTFDDTGTSRCFVIGPIGSKFAPLGDPARDTYEDAIEVFEKVIQPACRAVGLDPVRADQIAATGEITEQVFRRLRDDEVVIADVSGGNPNVMYELGLRHTRAHLTIQIGEYGQLPFDVSAIRTIQFSRSERGLIDARKELERALTAGLIDAGSPVSAYRVWNENSGPASDQVDGIADIIDPEGSSEDLIEPDGFIDQMAAFEMTLPELTETTERIGAVVEEMGAIAVDSTATIQAASSINPSAQHRLTLITRFAQSLQPKATELDELTRGYETKMNEVDQQLTGILNYLERKPGETGAEVDSFLEAIPEMARSSREAMENFSQFKVAMDTLSSMSKVLRRPSKDITQSIDRMMTATLKADDWESQVLRIRKRRAQERQLGANGDSA